MRVKLRRNTKIFFFFFFLIITLGIAGTAVGAYMDNGKIIGASVAFIFAGFFLLLFIGTHIVGGNIVLEKGTVIEKEFIPAFYKVQRRDIIEKTPEIYVLTLEGESKGKKRTLPYKVSRETYENVSVGDIVRSTKDFDFSFFTELNLFGWEAWADETPKKEILDAQVKITEKYLRPDIHRWYDPLIIGRSAESRQNEIKQLVSEFGEVEKYIEEDE